MKTVTLNRGGAGYPNALRQMHHAPDRFYVRGGNLDDLLNKPCVAIVGSRRMTAYGRQITAQWARHLAEQGVVIISGLATGVDAQAHTSALEAGGLTVAVLPSPVEDPVPVINLRLARQIMSGGGALVSTYPAGSPNHKGNFVARNEVVAALSDVIIITEATTNSGTRHTADFAEKMKAEVFAVPGPITSPLSAGCHRLIASNRAALAPDITVIMQQLRLSTRGPLPPSRGDTAEEQVLLDILADGINEGSELLALSGLSAQVYNQSLTMLEIAGKVLPLGADRWGLP